MYHTCTHTCLYLQEFIFYLSSFYAEHILVTLLFVYFIILYVLLFFYVIFFYLLSRFLLFVVSFYFPSFFLSSFLFQLSDEFLLSTDRYASTGEQKKWQWVQERKEKKERKATMWRREASSRIDSYCTYRSLSRFQKISGIMKRAGNLCGKK